MKKYIIEFTKKEIDYLLGLLEYRNLQIFFVDDKNGKETKMIKKLKKKLKNYKDVRKDFSHKQNTGDVKESKDSTGGDISQ